MLSLHPLIHTYRAHSAAIRRLNFQPIGDAAERKDIERRNQERQKVVHELIAHGRKSLVDLLVEESATNVDIAARMADGVTYPELVTKLNKIHAEIQRELDPTIITRGQAEEALAEIKRQFADRLYEASEYGVPQLNDHEHEGQPPGCWSIWWEGYAEDWAFSALRPGTGHRPPHGVGVGAGSNCILHLYPES